MDYEKKYKEMKARVLEIGQGYVKGVDFSKPRQIAEYICPELVESEDERIRKAIINVFASHKDYENFYGASVEDILAWLEKQGEQKQWVHVDPISEEDKLHLMFDGQKPADKVEQKFKVGDWVIFNNHHGSIYQVEKIENYRYCLRHYLGGLVSVHYDTDLIRRWTIQDAKDGDVLAVEPIEGYSYSFVAINKKQDEKDFDSYCFVAFDGTFHKGECGHSTKDIHPATKEQRDFLFQKMHEAGYEWDAERKKLSPLSKSEEASDQVIQQPTLEDAANAFLQALSSTPYNNTPVVEAQFAVKQLLTFLSDPKAYDPDAINEHKSAEWSEEDEQLIDEVAVCLRKYEEQVQGGYSKFYVQSLADRIESLRPGNTCKATGWSEEDEKVYQSIMDDTVQENQLDGKQIDWLRSLKQKLTWKPSKEQMYMLEWLTTNVLDDGVVGNKAKEVLNTLIEQLKQL